MAKSCPDVESKAPPKAEDFQTVRGRAGQSSLIVSGALIPILNPSVGFRLWKGFPYAKALCWPAGCASNVDIRASYALSERRHNRKRKRSRRQLRLPRDMSMSTMGTPPNRTQYGSEVRRAPRHDISGIWDPGIDPTRVSACSARVPCRKTASQNMSYLTLLWGGKR